ncbi:GntR family transcriptional regulator [Sphingobium algorifonticola]|uniref:GntR family transcriptional regulator n=1 Tax=Sphingobium algorifonticola TaxID=2008318 RepID=A0A437J5F7_9SPHN|nr:GntR family transcriptional regulator [Sphingobium algorifonticola]RVT40147.1 GntR family transcriptional regulator [Sphingobium algorifonticola]
MGRLQNPAGKASPAVVDTEADDIGKEEPRKGRLRLDAVKSIRKMIFSGELAPGERLREVALSEELGMSRTPIREAFRTLAGEGLIDLLPNRSVIVSVPDKSEAADVFTVLGALEALAGQLATQRMSLEQIEILGELHADLAHYFETANRLAYLEANRLIHEYIVEASDSPSLVLAWRLLLPRAERARHVTTLDHDRWAEAFQEHCEIYAAIVARDEARLKQLLESHFANGVESLKKSEARKRATERAEIYAGRSG